jgi:hypothetical protein
MLCIDDDTAMTPFPVQKQSEHGEGVIIMVEHWPQTPKCRCQALDCIDWNMKRRMKCEGPEKAVLTLA